MTFTYDGYTITTTNPGNHLLTLTFLVCIFCFALGSFAVPGCPLLPFVEKWFNDGKKMFFGDDPDDDNDNKNDRAPQEDNQSGRWKIWNKKKEGESKGSGGYSSSAAGDFRLQEDEETSSYGQLKTRAKLPRSNKRYGGIRSSNSMLKITKRRTVIEKEQNRKKRRSSNSNKKMVKTNIRIEKGQKRKKLNGKKRTQTGLKETQHTRIGRYEEKLELNDFLLKSDSTSRTVMSSTHSSSSSVSKDTVDKDSIETRRDIVKDTSSSAEDKLIDADGSEVSTASEMRKMLDLIGP